MLVSRAVGIRRLAPLHLVLACFESSLGDIINYLPSPSAHRSRLGGVANETGSISVWLFRLLFYLVLFLPLFLTRIQSSKFSQLQKTQTRSRGFEWRKLLLTRTTFRCVYHSDVSVT